MLRLRHAAAVAVLVAWTATACSGSSKQAPDSGADGGGDTDPLPDGGGDCDEVGFPLAGTPPSIVVLIDRSGSMSLGDQWEILCLALGDITAQMDNQIRFALMLFPHENGMCAPAPAVPVVPLADHNAAEIAAVLEDTAPLGPGTPTAMSLRAAYLYLLGESDETPKFVVLATDGAPNCSSDPTLVCETCVSSDPGLLCDDPFICLDDQATYGQVIEFHDNWGIDTYVIGMGGVVDVWDQVMSNIASHGGTGDFYQGNSPAALQQALQEIAAETTGCTFAVDWEALEEGTSTNPDLVNVYADGEVVPYSADCQDPAGWHWLDEITIALCEGLCHDYRWGYVSQISATFGCESYVE
jgi:hypothetical protein